MFKLSFLNEAKKKANVNHDSKNQEYENLFSDALKEFAVFKKTNDITALRNSAKKFLNCLHCKRGNPEPYYYLSLYYYLFKKDELAMQYYRTAKNLKSDLPDPEKLQSLFFSIE